VFNRMRIILGICVAGAAFLSASAYGSSVVPAQARFEQPPLSFDWNQVMSYKLKLVSSFGSPQDVYLDFIPEYQLAPGAPDIQGKGGVPVYHRTFHLQPFQTRTFGFRVHTPEEPNIGAYVNWCLEVTVMVKGSAPQSVKTCAIGPGK
jgi:hypothetical protein